MRPFICILFLLILIGCRSKIDLDSGQMAVFKGAMDSKSPVFLWMVKKQECIYGEALYYNGSNKPVKIIGYPFNNIIKLAEFLEDGTICGLWAGKIENDHFIGAWYSFNGKELKREYEFNLKSCDTILSDADPSIMSMDYYGNYRYLYGNDGFQISVSDDKQQGHYTLTFTKLTRIPNRINTDFFIDSIEIEDNESVCDLNGDSFCVFRIQFYKGFITINSIDDKRNCGFGYKGSVEGIYVKTDK